jgi:hypothetical protein
MEFGMSLHALDEFRKSYAGLGVLAMGAAPLHQVAALHSGTEGRRSAVVTQRYEATNATPDAAGIALRLVASLAAALGIDRPVAA